MRKKKGEEGECKLMGSFIEVSFSLLPNFPWKLWPPITLIGPTKFPTLFLLEEMKEKVGNLRKLLNPNFEVILIAFSHGE